MVCVALSLCNATKSMYPLKTIVNIVLIKSIETLKQSQKNFNNYLHLSFITFLRLCLFYSYTEEILTSRNKTELEKLFFG